MQRVAKQRNAIREHFKRGLSLTPLEALRIYGSFRLASVVFYLKNKEGMNIKTEMISDKSFDGGKVYARYALERKPIEILEVGQSDIK